MTALNLISVGWSIVSFGHYYSQYCLIIILNKNVTNEIQKILTQGVKSLSSTSKFDVSVGLLTSGLYTASTEKKNQLENKILLKKWTYCLGYSPNRCLWKTDGGENLPTRFCRIDDPPNRSVVAWGLLRLRKLRARRQNQTFPKNKIIRNKNNF